MMLKQRVLTALVLAPLIIWGVFSLPEFYFSLFMLCIVALASWEWGHLSAIQNTLLKSVYTLASISATALLVWYSNLTEQQFYILLSISIIWWLYRVFRVMTYRAAKELTPLVEVPSRFNPATALSIVVAIVIPFYGLIYLRNVYASHGYFFYLLMIIWGADIFAYFAGRSFGKKKLAPQVSPSKTWEGAYGAIAGTLLVAAIGSYLFGLAVNVTIIFFVLSVIIVVVSIFGDLSESLYKRQSGLKDSGNILPGHGGILDRIDSLIAAAPFYIVGLFLLGLLT